MHYWVLTG